MDVPVQALREFIARYGPHVSVLTTWSAKTQTYQFVTIGSTLQYSTLAVNLRNIIAENLDLGALGPTTEDLRQDHPNVSLNMDQINFLTWVLGRLFAEKDSLDVGHRLYIDSHHDTLLELFGKAKDQINDQPQ